MPPAGKSIFLSVKSYVVNVMTKVFYPFSGTTGGGGGTTGMRAEY